MTTKAMQRFDAYLAQAKLEKKIHQEEGVRWCLKKEFGEAPAIEGVRGGIIADEMGLGKTIVMSGLIVSNFVKHTLIVLPLALLDQWTNVFINTMHHEPMVYHGTTKLGITAEDMAKAPIVITTYGHLAMRPTSVEEPNLLTQQQWDRVIFDEAHHLRNMNTRVHIGALDLKAGVKWMVTGTPVQNRFSDFQALCMAMGLSSKYATSLDNVPEIVKHYMLRRRKEDVGLQLPQLYRHMELVQWEDKAEKQMAEDMHSLLQFSNVNKRNVDSHIAGLDSEILATLIRARQLCIYPQLLAPHAEKLVQMGVFEDTAACKAALSHSSKMNAVEKVISERKDNNRGKLIFCHYRSEIDELARRLKDMKMQVETFDGRTTHTQRAEILSGSCDALILQIQTGCEGLNLQQFSEIYFVSPHWNPAIEDQAVARCHRIGQTEPIDVFRFQMQGFDEDQRSISLDIHSGNVQQTKRKTSKALDDEAEAVRTGKKKRIKPMFTDKDELKKVAKSQKTKEGYLKDGFVMESN